MRWDFSDCRLVFGKCLVRVVMVNLSCGVAGGLVLCVIIRVCGMFMLILNVWVCCVIVLLLLFGVNRVDSMSVCRFCSMLE